MEEIRVAKNHFSKIGLFFAIGTAIIFAAQLIPMKVIGWLKPEWMEDPNISMVIAMVPMYAIGMPALIFLLKKIPAAPVEKRSMKGGHFIVAAMMCFGLVYLSNIIGLAITFIIGIFKGGQVQNVMMNITSTVSLPFIVIQMVILAPIYEEYIFRKLLVDRMARYGQGVAVLVSGLIFGLFHGNLNQFVYAFTLGMFLAFLYVKTGNIKITIALHMIINFMGGVVSTLLMNAIDIEEYMRVTLSGDANALMQYYADNAVAWALYGLFGLFVLGMLITAVVLFIVFFVKKRFKLAAGEIVLPKGKKFSTVILNVGMLVYCLFWVGYIIYQLTL